MEQQFWTDSWAKGDTGWRQSDVNAFLKRHWSSFSLSVGATVFVPLCGDSIDMRWLLERGHQVVGVELHRSAVESFFEQLNVTPEITVEGEFAVFRAANITIYCGDVFKVTPAMLSDVTAVYDRGATVALPEEMRTDFAQLMAKVLNPSVLVLLVGIVYDQSVIDGPPFSVPEEEIKRLYQQGFVIENLEVDRPEEVPGPLAERGLTWIENVIYKLARI